MKRFLKFNFVVVTTAAALLATQSGCNKPAGDNSAAPDTIKVGEFASLTGSEAAFGRSSHNGTLLAVEQINAAGGVLGKKLELITEDDQSKDAANPPLPSKKIDFARQGRGHSR